MAEVGEQIRLRDPFPLAPAATGGELLSPAHELKNGRLHLVVFIVLAGALASLAFHFLAGSVAEWRHVPESFLFSNVTSGSGLGDTYADLTNPRRTAGLSRYGGHPLSPPLLHLYYIVAAAMSWQAAVALQAFAFLAITAIGLWLTCLNGLRSVPERLTSLLILLGLSYPVLFVLERANAEMVLFLVLAGFMYLYFVKQSRWSVIVLGCAISMKLFPAVFLVLFLADRRYRWLLDAVVAAIGITLASLLTAAVISGRGIAETLDGNLSVLSEYSQTYAQGLEGLPYGHSLWGLLVGLMGLGGQTQGDISPGAVRMYTIAALGLFLLVIAVVCMAVRVPWQRVAILTAAALLLPTVSGDYRLIYVLLPLVMLINCPVRTWADAPSLVLCSLLLVPLDYAYGVVLDGDGWIATHTSTSTLIYPALLLTLVVVLVCSAVLTRAAESPAAVAEPRQ